MGGSVGESMGVVTDIRIRDLEAELTQLKSAWIDPIAHDQVKKELLQMTEAKETYQVSIDLVLVLFGSLVGVLVLYLKGMLYWCFSSPKKKKKFKTFHKTKISICF